MIAETYVVVVVVATPLSICHIAEAAIYCLILKETKPQKIKLFKILLDRKSNAE